jgi:hypothetical protein
MKNLRSIILLFAIATLLLYSVPAMADGCIIQPLVDPPLEGGEFIEPMQRCFIVDVGDGTEAMVLQIAFGKTDLSEFGWLVPLPSVPEVREESNRVFEELFYWTLPPYTYQTGGGCASSSTGIMPAQPLNDGGSERIDMIEKQVVGNFDVFTVEAETPEELKSWIEENDYVVPEGYESIFQNYINKGWIFVAIKVHLPEEINWYEGSYGPNYYPIEYSVLHPLYFQFETDELVYPMLISKLNGGSTDLTMFVLADNKMQFKDSKQKWAGWINEDDIPDYNPLEFYVRGERFLTKLRRVYFYDSDYDADLYLTQAPNNVEDRGGDVHLPANFLLLGFLTAGFPLLGRVSRLRKRKKD